MPKLLCKLSLTGRYVCLLGAIAMCLTPAVSQLTNAAPGYYPECYHGDVFSGMLTNANDSTREITLSYSDPNHKHSTVFIGQLEDSYTVSLRGGPQHKLEPSELPLGQNLSVYYCIVHPKLNGEKIKVNSIFLIRDLTNLATHHSVYMVFQ
jgi:hypothetical protein